ncbi:MAG: nitrile hydratase accessory protein [Cyanobacteria bacterium P01_F01_bin.86]
MDTPSKDKFPLSDPLQTDTEPVFQAPWEARAFAIVNQLANTQRYSWSEWTDQFVQEITAAENEPKDTSIYYERWVRACEKLLIQKGILDPLAIEQRIEEILIERNAAKEHDHSDHVPST